MVPVNGIGPDTLYIPIQHPVHFQPFDKAHCIDAAGIAGRQIKGVGAIKYDRRINPLSHVTGPRGYEYGRTYGSTTMTHANQQKREIIYDGGVGDGMTTFGNSSKANAQFRYLVDNTKTVEPKKLPK